MDNNQNTNIPNDVVNNGVSSDTPVNSIQNTSDVEILEEPEQKKTPNFIKAIVNPLKKSEDINTPPRPDMMISAPTDVSISTDDLLKDYIGKNSMKLTNESANFAAFFFTGAYFLYRKMYLTGAVFTALSIAVIYGLLLLNPLIAIAVPVIESIVLLFLFNKLYINNTRKKIDRLKAKNRAMSASELRKLCAKKGGTNIIVAIVFPAIIAFLVSSIMTDLFPIDNENLTKKITDIFTNNSGSNENNNNQNNSGSNTNETPKKKFTISSIEYIDDIKLEEKIDMLYLSTFKPNDANSDYVYDYSKLTTPGDENTNCKFKLGIVKNYDDSSKLIEKIAKYIKASDKVTKKESSKNITWNMVITTSDNGKTINYASANNGEEVYLFTYEIDADANLTLANAWYNGIIESIEFK